MNTTTNPTAAVLGEARIVADGDQLVLEPDTSDGAERLRQFANTGIPVRVESRHNDPMTRGAVDSLITERLLLFRERLEKDKAIPKLTQGLGGVAVD